MARPENHRFQAVVGGRSERQKLLQEARSQNFLGENFLDPSYKMCLDKVRFGHAAGEKTKTLALKESIA